MCDAFGCVGAYLIDDGATDGVICRVVRFVRADSKCYAGERPAGVRRRRRELRRCCPPELLEGRVERYMRASPRVEGLASR